MIRNWPAEAADTSYSADKNWPVSLDTESDEVKESWLSSRLASLVKFDLSTP